jgi:N-methylhydantoinase A/oxoprolinase/acetone carboxylase beta subunit
MTFAGRRFLAQCHSRLATISECRYRRPDIGAGTRILGPAIIEQLDYTTVVPPGTVAQVDSWLNIILRAEA